MPYSTLIISDCYKHIDTPASYSITERIMMAVCERYKITLFEIKQRTRAHKIVEARYIVMYLIGEYTKMSISKIAGLFNLDHSTYIHARKYCLGQLEVNKKFRSDMGEIRMKV